MHHPSRIVRLACVAAVFIGLAFAENWPQWRGPQLNGVSTEENLPVHWSTTENVAWKLAMPMKSGSTPIIWGNRLFLNVADGDNLYLWCVDKQKGEPIWKKLISEGNFNINKHNMSTPSPVTDGTNVYVLTGIGVLKGFDFAGNELWMRDIQADYGMFGLNHGYGSSPLLYEDALYVQVLHGMKTDDPSHLLRIDKKTGKTVWRVERPTEATRESPDSYRTPAVVKAGDRLEIVVADGDGVTGHDAATGKELWRSRGLNPGNNPANRVIASVVVSDGLVYVPSRVRPLLVFRPGGSGDVSETHQVWSFGNGPDVPTPVTDGKYFYSVNDRGIVWCLDAKTGEEIYGSQRIHSATYSSSPVLADGKIYVTSEDGVTTVMRAGPRFEVLAENDLASYTLSSAAISDGRLFLRTADFLYEIGKPQERVHMRLCAIGVLAMAALAADTNWPQFRGPSASGVGAGAPPVEWNVESGRNILWKTAIPGLGHSSPVVWGDRIFLTSAVPATGAASLKVGLYGDVASLKGEPAQSFKVFCVDRRSGKILWERTAASGRPKVMRHPKSSHANPTPASDGTHLVVFFGSEGLFAYTLDGKPLWSKDLGVLDSGFYTAPDAQWGFASSPVIFEGAVVIQVDVQKNSFLAAFEAGSGKELWRTPRNEVPTWGTPTVMPYTTRGAGGWQVVVNGWKHIGGYDVKTGKELWKLQGGGDIPVPTPVYLDGMAVITNAHGAGRPIYAIRTDAAGDLAQNRSAIAWTQERAGNYIQTPLLHGGLGYFCYDNGVLSVYRLATGERLYQQRLGRAASGFSSSPVAAAGRLYITNEEGHTYVLALGPEYKLLAESELGETVMATPAISGDVLYIRGGKHLFAVGARP